MPYIGTQPQDTRSFARSVFEYTATQGQTAFTGADDNSKTLGFTGREFQVFVNGVLMDDSDFTASNNNTITLASAANLNDVVTIVVVAKDIPIADFVPSGGDGTFTGREFQVFVNGVLMDGSDFTASNNNTITLASAANLNDIVTIIVVAKDIPIADFVPSGGDGTFTGSITNSGSVKGTGVGMFRRNDKTLSTNVTIAATENSVVGGPITVASGVTLTVATGGNLSVV